MFPVNKHISLLVKIARRAFMCILVLHGMSRGKRPNSHVNLHYYDNNKDAADHKLNTAPGTIILLAAAFSNPLPPHCYSTCGFQQGRGKRMVEGSNAHRSRPHPGDICEHKRIATSLHMNHHLSSLPILLDAELPSSFSQSLLLSEEVLVDKPDVAFEDAFNDQIDLFGDSTVQLLFLGFTILIALSVVAKSLLDQMDNAIEKVLTDFERVLKENPKYKLRWMEIQEQINGLEEPQRSQKLFEIMEELQKNDPQLMEKVNRDMMNLS